MTDTQLYLAIGVPALVNAAMFALVVAYINAKLSGMEAKCERHYASLEERLRGLA